MKISEIQVGVVYAVGNSDFPRSAVFNSLQRYKETRYGKFVADDKGTHLQYTTCQFDGTLLESYIMPRNVHRPWSEQELIVQQRDAQHERQRQINTEKISLSEQIRTQLLTSQNQWVSRWDLEKLPLDTLHAIWKEFQKAQ